MPLPLRPAPGLDPSRAGGQAGGLSGGVALAGSIAFHGALVVGAVALGLGRPPPGGGSAAHLADAPREVAFVPHVEALPPDEPQPFELVPPPPRGEAVETEEVVEALPEVALEPETAPPEELAAPEPLAEPVEALAWAGRRVKPLRVAARPPTEVAPAHRVANEARIAAPSVPEPTPPAAPRRGLLPRVTPSPTWPVGLAFQADVSVGLLLYVRADGTLADVRVERSSGLAALDEHVRAFVARTWSFEPHDAPRWARQVLRPRR